MDKKREQAIGMLVRKYEESGKERTPKKTDFSDDDICFIKQKLGPWTRALEEAGIKEKLKPDSKEINRLKRKKLKKKRREEKNEED